MRSSLLSLSFLPTAYAAVACRRNIDCVTAIHAGSSCVDGECQNPFTDGGCLAQNLPDWKRKRVCSSEDAEGSQDCLPSQLDYPEVRILGQNWESSIFQVWILQIVLSEMMGVPTSVELGSADMRLDFYAPDMPMDYGVAYDWEGHKRANDIGDCLLLKANDGNLRGPKDEYQSCAHVVPEIWSGSIKTVQELEQAEIVTPRQSMGALGQQTWFIPKFTGEYDPTLLNYLGLQGEENRKKLAATFLRPASWKEYCENVSTDGCNTPDEVAKRAPADEEEERRMFAEGQYTGHFRATDQNNCTKNPLTCTGHIVDYPCGWDSNTKQLTYHLDIALESNGAEAVSGGYSYSQMTEIWAAANATKNHVIMQWWTPEALYRTFMGTDASFEGVGLPASTTECVAARVDPVVRCEGDFAAQVGSAVGACADPPRPLYRSLTSSLETMSSSLELPLAQQSPAYDAISALKLTDLDLNDIFAHWLEKGVDKYGYDGREAACTWVTDNFAYIQTAMPKTYPRVVQQQTSTDGELIRLVAFVVSSIGFVVNVVSALLTIRNRQLKSFVKAQIEFIWLIVGGLLMVSLCAVVLSFRPSDLSCSAVLWLMNLGYTLELAPLIVKMAAINRIMVATAKMKRVVLKMPHLFGVVGALLLVVMTCLTAWMIVDTPHETIQYDLTTDTTLLGESIVSSTSYCSSMDDNTWNYMSLTWHSVLLLFAAVLAFQTRSIPRDVNESHTLAIMIYSHFVFLVLRAILFLIQSKLSKSHSSLYLSLILSLDTVATCVIYFFPKFFGSGTASAPHSSDIHTSTQMPESNTNAPSSPQRMKRPVLHRSHSRVSEYSRCEALKGALSEIGYKTSFEGAVSLDSIDEVLEVSESTESPTDRSSTKRGESDMTFVSIESRSVAAQANKEKHSTEHSSTKQGESDGTLDCIEPGLWKQK